MWKPLIRSAIVGGVIVFLWSMISWMVLPMHQQMMHQFTNASEVVTCLSNNTTEDGIYILPSWEQTQQGQNENAPFIFLNIRRGIDTTNMAKGMVCGIITQIIGAALITYLLLQTKGKSYWNKVWFVTIAGAAIAVLGVVPGWNWWHFPTGWAILEMLDLVVGWFIGGLAISKLIKK